MLRLTYVDQTHCWGPPNAGSYAALTCPGGLADVHLYSYGAEGLMTQQFSPVLPTSFSFYYSATTDIGFLGILQHSPGVTCPPSGIIQVYIETGGGINNRAWLYLNGTTILQVYGQTPMSGTVRVDFTCSQFVLSMNGVELGRAAIPPQTDLTTDQVDILAASTNFIDTHGQFTNVQLMDGGCLPPTPTKSSTWGRLKSIYR